MYVSFKNYIVTGDELNTMKDVNIKGSRTFTVTARLSGGQGDVAWQHTQLFRQPLDATDDPFEIKISLV